MMIPIMLCKKHCSEPKIESLPYLPNIPQRGCKKRKDLPFACTECGKCCQTTGDVYMSADEVTQASKLLGLPSEQDFVQTYASHTLVADDGHENHGEQNNRWIRVREKDLPDTSSCCIFLDPVTKHCGIYQARPTQCRTYPFWPPILASLESWNEECRRRDDDDDDTDSLLPRWTSALGGCEGMQLVNEKEPQQLGESDYKDRVPIDDVFRRLYEYQQAEQHFPLNGIHVPVDGNGNCQSSD